MNIFRNTVLLGLAMIALVFGQSQAHAQAVPSVIVAQLIDENPTIRGLAYVDGVLVYDAVLGENSFAGPFTGFFLFNSATLGSDINERVNIYEADGVTLSATYHLAGNGDEPLLHTFFFSRVAGEILEPMFEPTLNLINNGMFQTVLEFDASNGDHYVFEFLSVENAVPEPATFALFALGFLALGSMRRKRAWQVMAEGRRRENRGTAGARPGSNGNENHKLGNSIHGQGWTDTHH